MLCYLNHDILVTMVTKQTWWLPFLCVLKFMSGAVEESLYQIWGMEWKLRDHITLIVASVASQFVE